MCRRHRLPSVTTMSNTKNAVITGASRGLGLALARGLAADGWSLVIDARDADALRYAALCLPTGAAVTALPGDVADPAHRDALRRAAADLGGPGLPIIDPGDLRTRMHQQSFPGEDISDRPLPDTVIPAFVRLTTQRMPSCRYRAAELMPSGARS